MGACLSSAPEPKEKDEELSKLKSEERSKTQDNTTKGNSLSNRSQTKTDTNDSHMTIENGKRIESQQKMELGSNTHTCSNISAISNTPNASRENTHRFSSPTVSSKSDNKNLDKNHEFPFVPADHIVRDVYTLFRVEKELGHGASCRVLCVERKKDKKCFAMKEMKRDDKWNPILFEQEVNILTKLKGHSNILQFEDCFIDNKNFYILTGLCTGGELFDKIKELRQFPERHAAEIIHALLDVINYCHQRNIVHRDLKPENIIYKDEKREEVVLVDFGDAIEVTEHSLHDDFVGTAFYLSPEIIRTREGWELKKSDMWTIGVITYVLVTGRPPFWGRENKEIIRKIVKGQVHFPSSMKLSDECKSFILELLQKEPEKRLSAQNALKHPWIVGGLDFKSLTLDVLRNLATFGTSTHLKKSIVITVTENLSKKHRQEYESLFAKLDTKKDNKLDHEEIKSFLMQCGIEERLAEKQAQTLIINISGKAGQPISKDDWNYSNVAKLLSSNQLIERQHRKLDTDHDGFIGFGDLVGVFENSKRDEILKMIEEVDIDKDGLVGFEEFKRAMEFQPAYPY